MLSVHSFRLDTTYCPPPLDVLEHFAYAVCEELGPEYCQPDILRGLTDFLAVTSRICSAVLSRSGSLNPTE
jgi:hypothetical protein